MRLARYSADLTLLTSPAVCFISLSLLSSLPPSLPPSPLLLSLPPTLPPTLPPSSLSPPYSPLQLITHEAVYRWDATIMEGILDMCRILLELIAERLKQKPIPVYLLTLLGTVSMCVCGECVCVCVCAGVLGREIRASDSSWAVLKARTRKKLSSCT